MPASATAHRPELAGRSFEAMGVSLVVHPHNPYIPTKYAGRAFFIAVKNRAPIRCVVVVSMVVRFNALLRLRSYDAVHWHRRTARDLCQPFGDDVYPRYKKWCDGLSLAIVPIAAVSGARF